MKLFTAEQIAEQLAKHTERDSATGCLIWIGARSHKNNGAYYGTMSLEGHQESAHRAVLADKLRRALLRSEESCHTCDNTLCVEANHLFVGTHQENMRDMAAKGRSARGERHAARMREVAARGEKVSLYTRGEANGFAKLTEAQVIEIANSDGSQMAIANRFNISQRTVWSIKNRKSWRHLWRELPSQAVRSESA